MFLKKITTEVNEQGVLLNTFKPKVDMKYNR